MSFSREIKDHSSKNKKIRDRVDSRVQFVWRLRVMGSWIFVFAALYKGVELSSTVPSSNDHV